MNGNYLVALMQLSGGIDPFPWKFAILSTLFCISTATLLWSLYKGNESMKVTSLLAILLLIGVSLSGCAGGKLKEVSTVDLDLAITQAQAAGDTQAVKCFTEVKAFIGTGIPTVEVKGVFSALETARIGRRAVDEGIPEQLHIDCSPLIVDARMTLVKLGLLTRF